MHNVIFPPRTPASPDQVLYVSCAVGDKVLNFKTPAEQVTLNLHGALMHLLTQRCADIERCRPKSTQLFAVIEEVRSFIGSCLMRFIDMHDLASQAFFSTKETKIGRITVHIAPSAERFRPGFVAHPGPDRESEVLSNDVESDTLLTFEEALGSSHSPQTDGTLCQ